MCGPARMCCAQVRAQIGRCGRRCCATKPDSTQRSSLEICVATHVVMDRASITTSSMALMAGGQHGWLAVSRAHYVLCCAVTRTTVIGGSETPGARHRPEEAPNGGVPQTPAPPGSSHQALQPPGSGHRTPATRLPPPGSTATRLHSHQAPATRFQTQVQPPDSSHQVPATRAPATRLDPHTHDSTHPHTTRPTHGPGVLLRPLRFTQDPIQKRAQLFAHFACFLDIQLFFPSCGGPKHKTQKRDAKLSESQKHRNTTPSVKAETPKHRTPETQSRVDCW